MLYEINKVPSHPYYQLIDLPRSFFKEGINATSYSHALFPQGLRQCVEDSDTLNGFFKKVFDALPVSPDDREKVRRVFDNHNSIKSLCEDTSFREMVLPPDNGAYKMSDLHDNLKLLFRHMYQLTKDSAAYRKALGDLPIDNFREAFRNHNKLKVCPFCGLYRYPLICEGDAPLDHYLAIQHHPMAGVNFDNLIPICEKCNGRTIKGEKNVIRDKKVRRPAHYPFSKPPKIRIDVRCSSSPKLGEKLNWSVKVSSNAKSKMRMIKTWEEVFKIEARYTECTEDMYKDWLEEVFIHSIDSVTALRKVYNNLASVCLAKARQKEMAILREAFFVYVSNKFDDSTLQGLIDNHGYSLTTQTRGTAMLTRLGVKTASR